MLTRPTAWYTRLRADCDLEIGGKQVDGLISSMGEKVCLITGGNSGIGKATALGLANMGATVVIVSRDRSRGEAAVTEIKERSGNESVELMLADLSSRSEERRVGKEGR